MEKAFYFEVEWEVCGEKGMYRWGCERGGRVD
jgi:hypothetical protein